MPPPERVIPDKRGKMERKRAEQEERDEAPDPVRPKRDTLDDAT